MAWRRTRNRLALRLWPRVTPWCDTTIFCNALSRSLGCLVHAFVVIRTCPADHAHRRHAHATCTYLLTWCRCPRGALARPQQLSGVRRRRRCQQEGVSISRTARPLRSIHGGLVAVAAGGVLGGCRLTRVRRLARLTTARQLRMRRMRTRACVVRIESGYHGRAQKTTCRTHYTADTRAQGRCSCLRHHHHSIDIEHTNAAQSTAYARAPASPIATAPAAQQCVGVRVVRKRLSSRCTQCQRQRLASPSITLAPTRDQGGPAASVMAVLCS